MGARLSRAFHTWQSQPQPGRQAFSPHVYASTRLARPPASAADRVFPDCRVAGILVRRARRTRPVTLDGEAGRGHGAGRERKPRPGYLDAAEARGTGSGMAGAWRDPLRSRTGGRTPARDHPANLDAGRRPGRGTSRRGQPVRYRQPGCRRARLLRTLPPFWTAVPSGPDRPAAALIWVICVAGPCGGCRPRLAGRVGPVVEDAFRR